MALKDEEQVSDSKAALIEYVSRLKNLLNEKNEIQERIKDLKHDFKGRLDMKELNNALKVLKAEAAVQHQFEFESIVDTLRSEFEVLP